MSKYHVCCFVFWCLLFGCSEQDSLLNFPVLDKSGLDIYDDEFSFQIIDSVEAKLVFQELENQLLSWGKKINYNLSVGVGGEYPVYSVLVSQDQVVTGIIMYYQHSDFYKYTRLDDIFEAVEEPYNCRGKYNDEIVFFSNAMLRIYGYIPQTIESWVQTLPITPEDCFSTKSYNKLVDGQYIERDATGTPVAVVAYKYTIRVDCTPVGGSTGGPVVATDNSEPGNGQSGRSNPRSPIAPLPTTQNIRKFMVEECEHSYSDYFKLNKAAGAAYEKAVLELFGLQRNAQNFYSDRRAELTKNSKGGSRSYVQPDAISLAYYHYGNDGGLRTIPAIWYEVKAYSNNLRGSTYYHQLIGHIDAMSKLWMPQGVRPALFVITTSTSDLEMDIVVEATKKKVYLYRVVVDALPDGTLQFKGIQRRNFLEKGPPLPLVTKNTTKMICPNSDTWSNGRVDPEVADAD